MVIEFIDQIKEKQSNLLITIKDCDVQKQKELKILSIEQKENEAKLIEMLKTNSKMRYHHYTQEGKLVLHWQLKEDKTNARLSLEYTGYKLEDLSPTLQDLFKRDNVIYLGEIAGETDWAEKIYFCDGQKKDQSKPEYSHEFKTWSDEDGEFWMQCKKCPFIFNLG